MSVCARRLEYDQASCFAWRDAKATAVAPIANCRDSKDGNCLGESSTRLPTVTIATAMWAWMMTRLCS